MFLIYAHATPLQSSSHYGEDKGAYVNVYINYTDIDGAYALAKYYIEEEDWQVDEIEEECKILESIEDCEGKSKEYYEQAIEHGYSMVFHCYPVKEEENED